MRNVRARKVMGVAVVIVIRRFAVYHQLLANILFTALLAQL